MNHIATVAMPSDIQVSVKWKEQTIFAGEDVECIITFKNVAENGTPDVSSGPQQPPHQRKASRSLNGSSNSDGYFALKSPQALFANGNRRSLPQTPRQKTFDRSHRASASLSSPLGVAHSFPPSSGHKHKRSVSILSIESDGGNEKTPVPSQLSRSRPAWGHGRSASLQFLPRRSTGPEEIFSPGISKYQSIEDLFLFWLTIREAGRTPTRGLHSAESALSPSIANLRIDGDRSLRPSRPGSGAASPVAPPDSLRSPRGRAMPFPTDFKFPPAPPTPNEPTSNHSTTATNDESSATATRPPSGPSARDTPPSLTQQAHLAPVTKIISNSSVNGSSRSSGEFYSLSNNSTETLESEYTNYGPNRLRSNLSRHRRHYSSVEPTGKSSDSLTLLMGYAQISASFTVDGSLINQAVFEEVKRKGVVGSQGSSAGGPAAAEKTRRNGGLLSALGWNAIEESISGLLSSGDLNGLRDMRGVTSSKSIPLLSTPQSLLFVDLRLAPGEEKSFSFSFTLPRGLPASHKGKAIKFSYNLVIGTQRPSGPKEVQQVNRINVPFRVFSGVNGMYSILAIPKSS